MASLKLIDESRIDELIAKCEAFIKEVNSKETISQEELRFALIMEGQALAYKMIKAMELKPVPVSQLEAMAMVNAN